MPLKKRLDVLVVESGLADTREKAQALIMAGQVLIDEQSVTKAGTSVPESAVIRLKSGTLPYVSRGGLKIEGAVARLGPIAGLEIKGKICADVGSSTGGFTHYLLLNGAARVYAIDVDVTQLAWRLQTDPRVIKVERNARLLEPGDIAEPADLVTVDASFISLVMLLPNISGILKTGGYCLALVKPQFEVEREKVGAGGIVTSEQDQAKSVEKIVQAGGRLGWTTVGTCESPITGREGNREFFVLFGKSAENENH